MKHKYKSSNFCRLEPKAGYSPFEPEDIMYYHYVKRDASERKYFVIKPTCALGVNEVCEPGRYNVYGQDNALREEHCVWVHLEPTWWYEKYMQNGVHFPKDILAEVNYLVGSTRMLLSSNWDVNYTLYYIYTKLQKTITEAFSALCLKLQVAEEQIVMLPDKRLQDYDLNHAKFYVAERINKYSSFSIPLDGDSVYADSY